MRSASSKVWQLTDLPRVIDRDGFKLVHAHGCFDPLHAGHVRHLEEASKMGDVLIVTVTGDRYVNKPGRPAFSAELRALVVAALECVDFVAINEAPDATEAIRFLRPDVFVKGGEYRESLIQTLVDEKIVTEMCGGQLRFTCGIKLSSTDLLKRLTEVV